MKNRNCLQILLKSTIAAVLLVQSSFADVNGHLLVESSGIKAVDRQLDVSLTENGEVRISWNAGLLENGRLQVSTNCVDWTEVSNASRPFFTPLNKKMSTYYRVVYALTESSIVPPPVDLPPVDFGKVGINGDSAGDGLFLDQGTPVHIIDSHEDGGEDGNTGAITMGVNPDLVRSEIIEDMIGGPVVSATIILTDARIRLMVEGAEASVMLEYTPETGEGRIGFGEPTYDGDLSLVASRHWLLEHGLDPQDLEDFRPDEIYTGNTDAIGSEFADQTLALIDRMLAMGEQIDQLGRVEGWLSEALTAWAQYYYGNDGYYSDKNDDGVIDRLDWGPNGDMDGDGILNKNDDDDDNDGVKDWNDRFPNDPAYSIWAQSEGGVIMLTDSPVSDIGDVDRTFDFQVEALEQLNASGGIVEANVENHLELDNVVGGDSGGPLIDVAGGLTAASPENNGEPFIKLGDIKGE